MEELQKVELPESKESQILGVSVRAWMALLLVGTVCVMSLLKMKVEEPLYSAGLLALGFYFGQKK